MTTTSPKISVVMSVYNGEPFLREAVDSILAQTFTDFEFIIVDDCSTDDSLKTLRSYRDPRIKILESSVNQGIPRQVNRGIAEARGKYIARMDSDDISLPDRFQKQYDFLESHPDFGLLGGEIEKIDRAGQFIGISWNFSAPAEEVPIVLLFTNYFAQPTVMIRRDALPEGPYREKFIVSSDYDLWTRIADNWQVWNLPETLIKYRDHGGNISSVKQKLCRELVRDILGQQLAKLKIEFSPDDLEFHNSLSFDKLEINQQILNRADKWYLKIYQANEQVKKYDRVLLFKSLFGRWSLLCRQYQVNKFQQLYCLLSSSLLKKGHLGISGWGRLAMILIKRLFR
ncbi:MAG: glycosyltransferase [Candidatus Paceibacterota bacterium]|jgi:glycosyltransferase involved in cell wall biosynthesis